MTMKDTCASCAKTAAPAAKPNTKPDNPRFSSGPTSKRPGWSLAALEGALAGRSHRSKEGKAQLQRLIDLTRETLGIPADYRIGITPASDTGAVEMALWSLLGPRPVDVIAWESFGKGWVSDILNELKIKDARKITTDKYGELPDLSQADPAHDVVFTWNGTTSGVRVPNGGWISDKREGLTICDATSAVYAMPLPWDKLDVTTYSWQKVLGGEAQHGMIVLSPRAVQRLETYAPPWPVPKIFRLTKKGKLNEAFFQGEVINTCSMLCVADMLDALEWTKSLGGSAGTIARTQANFDALAAWVARTPWIDFLAKDPATRSTTSVCLAFTDPHVLALGDEPKAAFAKRVTALLAKEGAALDCGAYRDAPPGLRLWLGATVEKADVAALLPWLEWAFLTAKSELNV
ncbi:MAG: phosphoserine transaminase [Alphaproteobacteria bacterium]|nr:phosphoserine transaminase [Alphaproteobacteria bacterium]